ncbi:MAG: hypothetical protein MJY78_05915 [Fibrobacter sp.]|nr:hypothetical protein [Fibrobacter sp.]MCQ2121346.1 hypothetical protein [Fibrobacter sp.]
MPFTKDDRVKMFQRMGAVAAVIALILIFLIESGIAKDENLQLANFGLTAMIVVLAVALGGSMISKWK